MWCWAGGLVAFVLRFAVCGTVEPAHRKWHSPVDCSARRTALFVACHWGRAVRSKHWRRALRKVVVDRASLPAVGAGYWCGVVGNAPRQGMWAGDFRRLLEPVIGVFEARHLGSRFAVL